MRADVWVIHDPQPLPLRSLVPLPGAAIWRCHIDCSAPNVCMRDYVMPWVQAYDRAVFSMPAYTLPGLSADQVHTQQPCIDPLTPKNRIMRRREAARILAELEIDPKRPLVTQISRFDPWKNPWQAVDAYRLAKRKVPNLQLALVGVFAANDDPEAPGIYRDVRRYVGNDPDVYLLTDPERVGPRQVSALQTASEIVLQRSTREGFGLTVTEAMWKGRPVIATPVGGIPAQIEHGKTGFLVESADDSARIIVQLLGNPALARRIGRAAHRSVQERYLLPRLLLDERGQYRELLGMGNVLEPAA
jgi:trehalose synthase